MKVLQAADPLGKVLFLRASDGPWKRSQFTVCTQKDGVDYAYHTLSCQLVRLSKREAAVLAGKLCDPEISRELAAAGLLVPEERDEAQTYLEYYRLLCLHQPLQDGKNFYKIFTTSACNARCFYCFERQRDGRPMDEETADAVIGYILRTACRQCITLYWFGGEPLCNIPVIDRICNALSEKNVPFSSFMVSNGSLFTPALCQRAKTDWRLRQVQITLDGLGEIYRMRKHYLKDYIDPFSLVIANIRELLHNGIAVLVRLNMDDRNAESILQTAELLCREFDGEKLLTAYPALLFEDFFHWKRSHTQTERDHLMEYWTAVNNLLARAGKLELKPLPRQPRRVYCMANDPRCAIISQDGKLYTCQNCDSALCYGSVQDGVKDPALLARWQQADTLREKCCDCPFLPACTPFSLCPEAQSDCRRARHELTIRQIHHAIGDTR